MSTERPQKPIDKRPTDDVLFHSLYGVRSIELNRPDKLNSLNMSMASKILPRLQVGDIRLCTLPVIAR